MDPFFFRVEHDLVRSEAFRQLNGSAIKVYLVIGLYADFETGWAYPSIRTIAKQAGLSRQTVLNAIEELVSQGIVATSKSTGRSTAYRILHNAPPRPSSKSQKDKPNRSKNLSEHTQSVPIFLDQAPETVLNSRTPEALTGPFFNDEEAQFWNEPGPESGPKQEQSNKNSTNDSVPSIDIPGTPFRVTIDGRLLSLMSMDQILIKNGVNEDSARYLAQRYEPDRVIRAILNVMYLDKSKKLQNAAGYLRMALEKGYELLPQMTQKIEKRRSLLTQDLGQTLLKEKKQLELERLAAEEAAINLLIGNLKREELERLIRQAVSSLPEPLVKRNPSITNPLIRARVYELATRITESN